MSYSDTGMGHHGYIYQACNFFYTGITKERTDVMGMAGKHSRHYTEEDARSPIRKVRTPKHRYVYFCTNSKKLKKIWKNSLKYVPQPYPKGDNLPDYKLGEYMKETLVDTTDNNRRFVSSVTSNEECSPYIQTNWWDLLDLE